MFDLKKISHKLLGLSLLATVGLHNINETSAKLIETQDSSSTNNHGQTAIGSTEKYAEDNWQSQDGLTQEVLQEIEIEASIVAQNSEYSEGDSFFNFDPTAFEEFNSETGSPQTKFIRILSLSFFLLLFVPFGIFYPFFLFYKKLLNLDMDEELGDKVFAGLPIPQPESDTSYNSFSSGNRESTVATVGPQATVSKLQIAFLANDKNRDIRQELTQLCSSVDPRTEEGTTELMQKTISLLIEKDEITHVSCDFKSLEVEKAKKQFEIISGTEKSKIVGEDSNLDEINNPTSKINPSVSKDGNLYSVVTLIFCTSQTELSPEAITTKKKLVETLSKFAAMGQDKIIKFDLLWNPEVENRYLTNGELLLKHIDMMRLF